jgi:hypothetical protein
MGAGSGRSFGARLTGNGFGFGFGGFDFGAARRTQGAFRSVAFKSYTTPLIVRQLANASILRLPQVDHRTHDTRPTESVDDQAQHHHDAIPMAHEETQHL